MNAKATDGESKRNRPWGVLVVAILLIIFGAAEVMTGFTHNFLGISTSQAAITTYLSAAIGSFYIIAGLVILTMKRWAATLAVVLLGLDIVGRVVLVATGYYPLDSTENIVGIVGGTAIAVFFAIYILLKWAQFK
jgi:drug/metabolite transporter (DMT)-like permease